MDVTTELKRLIESDPELANLSVDDLTKRFEKFTPSQLAMWYPVLFAEERHDGWQECYEALERTVAARELIIPEQEKLTLLIDEAQNDIERAARTYQRDLVAWQITRAADIAEKRLEYITAIGDWDAENNKCELDTVHWFEMFAWTIDPRPDSPLSVMPLALFEFQERYIKWLDYITFEKRASGVVEKCRTMGATEVALRWMLKHWRYKRDFYAMPLSANEDLVDSKKDPGTLFEKLRFQLRLLPQQMRPKGFNLDKDMPYMQLVNADNGSVIQGEAPTVNVGRQRRATAVLKDESAAWPNGGYQQHTALSRTANTLIDVSSVQGKFNKFADLAHDGRTPKFEMDWREHPWFDQRWYDSLPFGYIGPAMTPEEIAQEIDRNYEASQPGKVIKNCREEYCFITQEELLTGFAQYKDLQGRLCSEHFLARDGSFRIPSEFNWGRVSDYGMSARQENDTHIWAYNLFARPKQSFPFTDSLFFFCALPIEPIGASELEAFRFYSDIERKYGVRGAQGHLKQPGVNDFSHEAKDAKAVLLNKCGDNWNTPDLDFFKGVSKLRYHFEITDKHLDNPFRPELKGRSRIYFVAPKGEYQLAKNERTGAYFVTGSQTQHGFKRLRQEIQSWHFPPEERGKPIQKMRPKEVFDDILTTVRYALARWGVESAQLTKAEKIEEAIPDAYKYSTLLAASPHVAGLTPEQEFAYVYQMDRAKKKVTSRIRRFDEITDELIT